MKSEQGYIGAILTILLAFMVVFVLPVTFSKNPTETLTPLSKVSGALADNETFCNRVEGGPIQQIPKYDPNNIKNQGDADSEVGSNLNNLEPYQLKMTNVPVSTNFFTNRAEEHRHGVHVSAFPKITEGGKEYKVYFTKSTGYFKGKVNGTNLGREKVSQFGIIFAVHLVNGQEVGFTPSSDSRANRYWVANIYQKQGLDFPQSLVTECIGEEDKKSGSQNTPNQNDSSTAQEPANTTPTQVDVKPQIEIPDQQKSETNDQLQLEYFRFIEGGESVVQSGSDIAGGWKLGCKPAIYLYPKVPTNINVKVNTKGFLTYTDPKYPEDGRGWDVTAYPDGTIHDLRSTIYDKPYPYLYYESKVPDGLVEIPEEGYIVPFDQFVSLHNTLLPKLGLLDNQTQEYINYWTKALPYSSYYFVGIMPQSEIDKIEPLDITPKPDQNIRVRLYYQLLDTKPDQLPDMPDLTKHYPSINDLRSTIHDLTMIEWGGMVKLDKDHPFTCSQ